MAVRRLPCGCLLPVLLFLRRFFGLSGGAGSGGAAATAANAAKASAWIVWLLRLLCLLALVLLSLRLFPNPKPPPSFREPPWAVWDLVRDHDAAELLPPPALEPSPGPDWSPRYVHQTWGSARLPARFARLAASWRRCFPKAHYRLWTDADNRRFVRRHYPWFLWRYDALPAAIYRADAIRYLLLFHFGGIYADLDAECLRPFPHLLAGHSIVLGAMTVSPYATSVVEDGLVQNSFMYARPRQPFWLEMVHYILAKPTTDRAAWPEEVTGPTALMYVLRDYRRRFPKAVTVYPPRYFNPFSWMLAEEAGPCKVRGRMTDEEMVACRKSVSKSSYVVQYHFHTWTIAPPPA